MAEVIIKEAMVQRLIPGHGFVVAESYKRRDGEIGKNYFTVWSQESVQEGDVLNIKGLLSVKLDEYQNRDGQTKQSAQAHINNAQIEKDVPF